MTYLETGVYQLSTLSPVHIRVGKLEEYGQGFIRLKPTDDFLYVIDIPKLQAEIYTSGNLDMVEKYVRAYAQAFSNPRSKKNIVQILKQIGYDYKLNIEKISKGIVRIPQGNRFMLSGLGKHFVPGSSIKGAIKTAVLYHNVKQQIDRGSLDLNDFVTRQIGKYQGMNNSYEKRKFRESFAANLLKGTFQSAHPQELPWIEPWIDRSRFAKLITPPGTKGTILETLEGGKLHLPLDNIVTTLKRRDWIKIDTFEEKNGERVVATYTKMDNPPNFSVTQNQSRNNEPAGPFTDIFKAIKVKDVIVEQTMSFEDILFTTLSGRQIVKKNVGNNTRFECFCGETTVEISIDHEILGSFKRAGVTPPFSDVKSLVTLCQNFAQAQWDAEKQFLAKYPGGRGINLDTIKKFYADSNNEQLATLRVGWGTGMIGTTISLLLDGPTRIELRNEVISSGHHNYPGQPAPKSRRFVLEGKQPTYPLGWVALTET